MAFPSNILTQVQTYQPSELAYLQNLNCMIATANTKFKDFNNITANLGSSVSFDLPYRFTTTNTLVAQFQPITQLIQVLTVDQARNTAYTVTNQDEIFNLDKDSYMTKIGMGAIHELSAQAEINLALNAISACPVGDSQGNPTGALHTESGPVRFYGDGTPINSYQQLQQAITNFKDYGCATTDMKFYLPITVVPPIIGTGLNQFAPKRNDEIAMSWEIGEFANVKYYQSNQLPIHVSGSVGNAGAGGNVLTVLSTNDPTGANITQITFSGATPSDSNAIKSGDLLQFNWNVSGQPNLYYATYTGHTQSSQPVQVRAIANAGADGAGHVVVTITSPNSGNGAVSGLSTLPGADQNIFYNIVAGMKATVMPSHRAGLITSANAFYLAMPRLDNQEPFPTSSEYDPDTGVSMRLTYGTLFGQNQKGFIHDMVWGSLIVPQYSMRVLFPL